MNPDSNIDNFLSAYSEDIHDNAQSLRIVLLKLLPDIIEQLDLPAKMIAYTYGQSYKEMICIIPSKKGLKLGFYKGVNLPDPHKLLKGEGKISRYTNIMSPQDVSSDALIELILNGLNAYQDRTKK